MAQFPNHDRDHWIQRRLDTRKIDDIGTMGFYFDCDANIQLN